MKILYLDIETIPTQKPGALDEIRANIKPPGTIKKPESVDKWHLEKGDAAADEAYRKTSLNGTYGEVVVIGFAIDDREPESFQRDHADDESLLLTEFFDYIACHITGQFQIVGHNVRNFDLRFMFQRCVINSIEPSFNMRHEGRYNDDYVFDTMLAWGGWNNYVKLEALITALDIPLSKGDMDGSKVWDYIQAGLVDDVASYCRDDVARTREVFKRLTFGRVA